MINQSIIVLYDSGQQNSLTDDIISELTKNYGVVKFEILPPTSLVRLIFDKKKWNLFKTSIRSLSKNSISFSPITFLPFQRFTTISRFNPLLTEWETKWIISHISYGQQPILWIDSITEENSHLILHLNESVLILHSRPISVGRNLEERIYRLERQRMISLCADLVITSSKDEYQEKKKFNQETYLYTDEKSATKLSKVISKKIVELKKNPQKRQKYYYL